MDSLIQEFLKGHTFCYKFNLRPPHTALVAMTSWDILEDSYDELVLLPFEDMYVGEDCILPKHCAVDVSDRPQYKFRAPCYKSWRTTINGMSVDGLTIQTRMMMETFGLVMDCVELRRMAEIWPDYIARQL